MRRPILALLSLTLALTAAGCGWVHRIPIQQGNLWDGDTLAKVRVGMERRQVRILLGTPAVQDTFHPERWDYYYRLDKSGEPVVRRHVTVWFENDRVARIEHPAVPDPATP